MLAWATVKVTVAGATSTWPRCTSGTRGAGRYLEGLGRGRDERRLGREGQDCRTDPDPRSLHRRIERRHAHRAGHRCRELDRHQLVRRHVGGAVGRHGGHDGERLRSEGGDDPPDPGAPAWCDRCRCSCFPTTYAPAATTTTAMTTTATIQTHGCAFGGGTSIRYSAMAIGTPVKVVVNYCSELSNAALSPPSRVASGDAGAASPSGIGDPDRGAGLGRAGRLWTRRPT